MFLDLPTWIASVPCITILLSLPYSLRATVVDLRAYLKKKQYLFVCWRMLSITFAYIKL